MFTRLEMVAEQLVVENRSKWEYVPNRPVLFFHMNVNSDLFGEYFALQFFVNRLVGREKVGNP